MRFIDKTRADLAEIISADLQSPVAVTEVERRFIDWIEQSNRRLPDEKWKIKKSKEFLANPFVAQYAPGLDIIENNFRNGVSNKAHQNRAVDRTDYHDLLFNDWGIHHFHLADTYRSDGFCDRTGPVLFAYFDNDAVYFVDILEHGRGHADVWVDEHLIAVIDHNWPEISNKYHIKEAIDLSQIHTAPERIKLRNAGIASLLKVNGKVFVPFGLGLNTAKGSTRFSLKALRLLRFLKAAISDIKAQGDFTFPNKSTLSQGVPKNVRFGVTSAIIRIRFADGRLELYEEKSSQAILYSAKIVG